MLMPNMVEMQERFEKMWSEKLEKISAFGLKKHFSDRISRKNPEKRLLRVIWLLENDFQHVCDMQCRYLSGNTKVSLILTLFSDFPLESMDFTVFLLVLME